MNGYNTEDLSRLEPDYLESFGLHEAPFSTQHLDKFLYIDAERAQALNLLQHLTHYSNLLLIVQGEQGVGKTAMKQRFVKNAEPDWRICEVNANTMMDAEQLLFQAAQGFGVTQLPEDAGQLQEMLYARIATLHHKEQVPILIIDDAHQLPKDALLAIFNLADAYVNDVNLLRIILFCEPLIEKIISSKEVRPLRERVTHTTEIMPFDEETTADYLKHRMAVAGFNGGSPFTPKMIKQIYRASRGVPAKINELAHQMLQQGDIEQALEIPEDVVTIRHPQRNNMPIVFASIAVVVIALVLVFQDKINHLFDESPVPADQQLAAVQPEKTSEQILAEQTIHEKIIPLTEPAASTQPAAESPPAQGPQPEIVTEQLTSTVAPASPAEEDSLANPQVMSSTKASQPQVDSLQLYSVVPDPVPASVQKQTLSLNGQGFTPESEVMVSWANKQKRLSAEQVMVKNDKQIDITITVGSKEDQWNVRVLDPKHGQSNILAFEVKSIMVDEGNQRDKWVVSQNPENFTLQLLATHEKQNADNFIKQHQLAGDVGYFESSRNGKPWYSVIYGSYNDQATANSAIASLPASMKKIKPWVRRFDDIQAAINANRKVAKKNKPKAVTQTAAAAKPGSVSDDYESWLWSQDPRKFTLQLLGARQTESVQQFLRKYADLNGKAVYFHTRHDSRDWYAVVYGVYASREQAQQAIKRLPAELQSGSPWIRSFASIHAELDRTDQ